MEQIKLLEEQEATQKKRAQSANQQGRRKPLGRYTPKRALIQKKKTHQIIVDPVDIEFLKMRKDVGAEF